VAQYVAAITIALIAIHPLDAPAKIRPNSAAFQCPRNDWMASQTRKDAAQIRTIRKRRGLGFTGESHEGLPAALRRGQIHP
jgi:hypothetical protein